MGTCHINPRRASHNYGILARAAGGTGQAARSVSSVLSKTPNQAAIPWHRIVYSSGRVWLSPSCEAARRALYAREGIVVDERGMILNFEEVLYYFE